MDIVGMSTIDSVSTHQLTVRWKSEMSYESHQSRYFKVSKFELPQMSAHRLRSLYFISPQACCKSFGRSGGRDTRNSRLLFPRVCGPTAQPRGPHRLTAQIKPTHNTAESRNCLVFLHKPSQDVNIHVLSFIFGKRTNLKL